MQQAQSWKQRFVITTLASALCVALVGLSAWGQEGPGKAAPAKDGPALKPLAFEFRDTPWDKVLDWLADNSGGIPVVSTIRPQGTFNFVSPAGKKYTLPQIIDILNRSLLSQKILIVRNTTNYTVISNDEAQTIDTTILPNITIDELDVDKPYDQQKYGQSELCQITFNLNGLTVDEAETNLGSRKGPFGRFQKIPKGNMLLATDTVGNLRQMKKLLDKIDPGGETGNIEVFPLRPSVNGAAMETTIKGMFNLNPGQSAPPGNPPKIQYDETQHKLIVNGDKAQLKMIREALTKLNALKAVAAIEPGPNTNQGNAVVKGPGPAEDAIRIINLKEGNASQYVDNLRYLLSSLRANPVFVTYEPLMIQSIEDARKGGKPKDPVTGKEKELQLTDEKRPIPQLSNKPGSPDKPVFIATLSRTNGVMIGSDDPEALDFAEQILAYLTKAGDEYYEVIPLKNSNATIVRDTLDELINGKKQQGGMGGPFGMMMGGMGGGGMRDAITGPVVRLAADKRTNSILVRAPRQIVVTIKRFIETELDVNNIDQKLQPKPHIVQLKHAFATDVVDVLKEIYREYIDTRASGGGMGGMPVNPFMPPQPQQQPERSIRLAVTANKSDNSVILNCPDVLWEEVDNLITHLDKNNSDTDKEAKIINIGKADPQMLKNALDTITGKQTGTGTNPNANDPLAAMRNAMMNRFGGMGGMGGPGMGGGGGRQGGGGRPGGGGGRPGGGRGGNRSEPPPAILSDGSSLKPGGSDFFEGRVKDDPRTQVTFEKNDDQNSNNIVQAQAQTPATAQNQPPVKDTTPGKDAVQQPLDLPKNRVPRGEVTYQVLPDGQVILIGPPDDIKLVEEILKDLVKTSPTAETELKMFPLKHLDAGTMTLKLSEIFVRYNPVTRVLSASTGAPSAGGVGTPGGFGGMGAQQRPGGFGQGGFGQGLFGQGGFGQGGMGQGGLGQAASAAAAPSVTPSQVGSILLVAISRQNSILVAGPKSAMDQVEKIIRMLDVPNSPNAQPVIITLKRANATRVATTITNFYQQRFLDSPGQNDVRITPDTRLNSLIVFASPEDVREIQSLVEFFDKSETKVVNEVRIRTLKYSSASELATTLQQALSQALFSANAPTTGTTGTGQQGNLGGFPNIFGGGFGGLFGNQGGLGGAAAQNQDRRGVSLSFGQAGRKPIETGLLEDVGIFADVRTNRLVISAPAEAMAMMDKLIDELDVPPTIVADVKVFRLKNADATNALNTVQSIFTGQQRTGTGVGGGGGGIGAGGGFGAGLNQQQQMNFTANQGQGPQPIIPRFSVDVRTNSLIVAAGRGDMMLAEVIINNLDSAVVRDRMFQVVRLKNNQAGNVATNLNSFFRNEITVLQLTELTSFLQTDREVTVIADATNNSIIVGASQRYFPEVMRLIDQLDIELAQVAIQVLIAQVRLDNTDEFGVEVGLQSPVLFDRSLFQPQPNTTNATTPIGQNGYNWNNVSTVNSSNQAVAGSTIVGMRGITNYGTGLSNPNTGIGGFVFSAASNSVNVLVRALRTQGRLEVLSRPQIVTRDNQQALISVGQQVPIVTGSTLSNGILQNTVEQQQVGIILKVLPQISPDGRIVMRVEPQISKVSQSTVDLGNGVKGTIIDQTIASTTIDATDGRTVIIGGLISKEDDKNQRGIPWLGDLPYVGALFRYRSQFKTKTELLIILTPHIIRNPGDAERVFMDESRKMSWSLDDVQALQGALPGATFLKQNCAENGLDHPINNPFNENYFAPNTTLPPVDERLGSPKNQVPAPGVQTPTPGVRMPAPAVPQQQQPPSAPGWLQPPGATPPMYQAPQGYVAPQAMPQQQLNGAWKTTVSYAPPQAGSNQPTIIQTQEMPIRQIQQAGSGSTGFAGGQQP